MEADEIDPDNTLGKYILDEQHNPVPCTSLLKWADWFEDRNNRRVAATERGGVRVSTVFLGLNHNWMVSGPPLLFETMIFGGPHDQYMDRCSTWEEAEQMHQRACQLAFGGESDAADQA